MNSAPDEPSEFDAPLTRVYRADEDDPALAKTEIDPDRTVNEADHTQTLEVTDPIMTRSPGRDLTAGSLKDWLDSVEDRPGSEAASANQSRRGIIGKIEVGQVLYSKYEVLKKLGGGAMGDVWLVKHLTLNSQNALKVIIPNFARSPVALMRFQREFQVMATLRHEHAVTIYDACIDVDGGYIDMEFVDGLTLDAILSQSRARTDRDPTEPMMSLTWITRVLEQLCEVLQVAHEKRIVHRDLKPSNMMLLNGRKPGKEYLKVLDFGIAKVRDDPEGASGHEQEQSSSKTEGFIGTPSYGSPEQAMAREDVDGRADLYSVGIMLYEFVTGRLPFRGSPLQVMNQNANTPPPPFYIANPQLRPIPEVERVIFHALEKSPEARPQTARELFDEFREAVEAVAPRGSSGARSTDWKPSSFYDHLHSDQTTERDNPAADQALRTTQRATPLPSVDRVEPLKISLESPSELGPVLADRKAPPWTMIAAVLGLLMAALLVVGLFVSSRSKPPVVGPNPKETSKLRFEEYWPEGYLAVDSSGPDQIWPEKVRRTADDRYFVRIADGVYLPEGYQPEDPNKRVDGWPAVIVRDKIRFLRIEGNKEWTMGAWDVDVEAGRNDVPAHSVKLSGYYLQETEVTNGQYEAYLSRSQSARPPEWERVYGELRREVAELAANHPAVNLSRKQAVAFARSLDAQLPTEAQWEFAARSRGEKRRFVWDDTTAPSRSKANIDTDTARKTAPVKSYPEDRTAQGAYDMLGNVQEFCRDLWAPYKRNQTTDLDPCVLAENTSQAEFVIRGGSFHSIPEECVLTRRDEHRSEGEFFENSGFRLVVECPDTRKKNGN